MNYYEQISSTMKLLDDFKNGKDISKIYDFEEREHVCQFIEGLVDKSIEEYAEKIQKDLQATTEEKIEITKEKIDEAIVREYNVEEFYITEEQMKSLKPSQEHNNISKICDYINEVTSENNCSKVRYKDICEWLVGIGYLGVTKGAKVSSKKHITQSGFANGLSYELNEKNGKKYKLIVYDSNAQKFIFRNLMNIKFKKREIPSGKKTSKSGSINDTENAGVAWDDEQEKLLIKYYKEDQMSVSVIARLMKRTRGSIDSRLRKMEREGRINR